MKFATKVTVAFASVVSPICLGQPEDREFSLAPMEDGGYVEYESLGDPNGEPVLLIHGQFFADALAPVTWQESLDDYRLILMHRRGFAGSSDVEAPFGVPDHATDALALLRHLDIERAHIVGYSRGGWIALHMAAYAPEMVYSLILLEGWIAPGVLDLRPPAEPAGDEVTTPRVENEPEQLDAEIERLRSRIGQEGLRWLPDALEQVRDDAYQVFTVDGPASPAYDPDYDLDSEVPRLTQPILFILGESGQEFGPYGAGYFRAHHPDMVIRTIGDTNHFFPIRKPRETARIIAEFLTENPLRIAPLTEGEPTSE